MVSDSVIVYMQMVQSTIDRMATTSAIFKGFTATVLSSFTALAFKEVNIYVLAVMALPMLGFLFLDIYYLGLERKYRALYQKARTTNDDLDFSMDVSTQDKRITCSSVLNCLRSKSILWFYLPCFIAYGILLVFKAMNFG